MLGYSLSKLLLVLATLLGAFGGFPTPLRSFQWLTQYQIMQWVMVFVLLYQGGAGEDVVLAGAVTAAAFGLHKIIELIESGVSVKDEL